MKYDIKKLSLDEKLHLLTGRDTWRLSTANEKLPEVFLSDGPNGLRMIDLETKTTKKATAMPNIHILASTWNTDLAYLDGATIADDCLEHHADVLLAPGVNIKRTPLCGRNFEYFSEDPYLSGVMAKAYIEGVQSKGVGTSLKHYCANNREYDRRYQNSDVDERTLREIYLPAFEIAVQAKPWTVMCSYNPVNGIYASENQYLLDDILRGEFGFDGLIVSDWAAVHHSARAVKASLDLRMPYDQNAYTELKTAYDEGWLSDEEIDACVERILAFMEKTQTQKKEVTTTKQQRHENAVKIAAEGAVLLKNDGILPLTSGKICVYGPFADSPAMGGGGSAYAETDYKPRHLAEELQDILGDTVSTANIWMDYHRNKQVKAGLQASYENDITVLCLGTGKNREAEGYDRTHLRLDAIQEKLIDEVSKYTDNIVVVLHAGSAIDMSAWIDKVKAVLLIGFSGEGAQEAAAQLLTGKISPSGKLTETFPWYLEDTPTADYTGNGCSEQYAEGVFVGYRWFDEHDIDVLFPFGHGLSYTNFAYSDLAIEKKDETHYDVCFTVTNTGNMAAKEVSQVYVRDVFSMVNRPKKELKGFVKTELQAGESKRVRIPLCDRAFAYYSVNLKRWYVENGDFEILVGASSRDIRLKEKITIQLPDKDQYSRK
ncbi:MAG: glycoside hydrolase family 3 C-terminal domain-containing protein [Clostridia bacterium]|nr:glycoside hydrolase family 3 C-terminal domain-containing protein [Clostridia bacterium]